MENGFQGRDGDVLPEMTEDFVNSVSERYIELYENITGDKFVKSDTSKIKDRIESAVNGFLKNKI